MILLLYLQKKKKKQVVLHLFKLTMNVHVKIQAITASDKDGTEYYTMLDFNSELQCQVLFLIFIKIELGLQLLE